MHDASSSRKNTSTVCILSCIHFTCCMDLRDNRKKGRLITWKNGKKVPESEECNMNYDDGSLTCLCKKPQGQFSDMKNLTGLF